jgi:hypothetical protein
VTTVTSEMAIAVQIHPPNGLERPAVMDAEPIQAVNETRE